MDWYLLAIEKLGLREITCWYSLENGLWVFNHADAGHVKSALPIGRTPEQCAAWKNKKWSKRFVYGDGTRWPITLL